jgi:dipeptide/tripeptide permease
MGQIHDAERKDAVLNEAFSFFYAAVNVGAALSSFTLPLIVRAQNGRYGLALMVPDRGRLCRHRRLLAHLRSER